MKKMGIKIVTTGLNTNKKLEFKDLGSLTYEEFSVTLKKFINDSYLSQGIEMRYVLQDVGIHPKDREKCEASDHSIKVGDSCLCGQT